MTPNFVTGFWTFSVILYFFSDGKARTTVFPLQRAFCFVHESFSNNSLHSVFFLTSAAVILKKHQLSLS